MKSNISSFNNTLNTSKVNQTNFENVPLQQGMDFPNIDIDTTHTNNKWLLVIDLLIFIYLSYLSYISSKRERKRNSLNEDFKLKFIQGLTISNGVRAFSLLIIILISNDTGNTLTSWINYFFHAIPAFFFVSAYMCLIIFLADFSYKISNYQNHIVKPTLLIMAVGCYAAIAIVSLVTFAFQLYKSYAYASEFIIGVIYVVIGSMIIHYGREVSSAFENSERKDFFDNFKKYGEKIYFMSISIGILFLIKSFFGLLTAFSFFKDLYPAIFGPNLWDFLMFLITEIAPTLIFIQVAKTLKSERSETQQELNDFKGRK